MESNQASGGLTRDQIFSVVRRHKFLIAGVLTVVPLLVYGLSLTLPKTYTATATINVRPVASASTVFLNRVEESSGVGETEALIQTTAVARRAAPHLNVPITEARDLLDHVEVTQPPVARGLLPGEESSTFLNITADSSSAQEAADIANAFAKAVAKVRTTQAIRDIDETSKTLEPKGPSQERSTSSQETLDAQLQQLQGLRASQRATTPLIESATPPSHYTTPKPLRNAIVAFLLTLFLIGCAAPFVAWTDRRLRSTKQFEDLVDVPLLGTIPTDAFPGRLVGPHVRESFQSLRANLTYFNIDQPLSTILVCSPGQEDGKTTVSTNLAVAYALDDRDVILVDADLRHPQVATRLGQEPEVGIDSVLLGQSTVDEVLLDVDAGVGRLRVLPGGPNPPPNPAVLIGSDRMSTLLEGLVEKCDIVIVDSPALLVVSDAVPLVRQVAGLVLVGRLNRTHKDALRTSAQTIHSAGGNLLGTVATGGATNTAYGYYGYLDGYRRASRESADKSGQTILPTNGVPDGDLSALQ